jgi:hypothetical protein
MRQVGDSLVWLGVILVIAAVVYFTPRFASFVTVAESHDGRDKVTWRFTTGEPAQADAAIR